MASSRNELIRIVGIVIASPGKESWVSQGMLAYPDSIARDWHFWSTFAQGALLPCMYSEAIIDAFCFWLLSFMTYGVLVLDTDKLMVRHRACKKSG